MRELQSIFPAVEEIGGSKETQSEVLLEIRANFFCFSQQNFLVKLKALFRCLRSRQQALQEDEGWFGGTTRKI